MEIIQPYNSGLQKEQNAFRKLQLFKATNTNIHHYFAGLTRFDIKGHNIQSHP